VLGPCGSLRGARPASRLGLPHKPILDACWRRCRRARDGASHTGLRARTHRPAACVITLQESGERESARVVESAYGFRSRTRCTAAAGSCARLAVQGVVESARGFRSRTRCTAAADGCGRLAANESSSRRTDSAAGRDAWLPLTAAGAWRSMSRRVGARIPQAGRDAWLPLTAAGAWRSRTAGDWPLSAVSTACESVGLGCGCRRRALF
jgi:hypothetical protein